MRRYVGLVSLSLLVLLLAGCFGGGTTPISSKGNLKGQIFADETEELITGQDVLLILNGKTLTVTDGKYSFSDLSPGPASLKVVTLGYQEQTLTLEIPAGAVKSKNIYLKRDPGDLEGLLNNLKDAGTAFTGVWNSELIEQTEEQVAPFIVDVGEQILASLGPLAGEGFVTEPELDYDEETGTLTATLPLDNQQTVVYQVQVGEVLRDLDFLPLQLETLLNASFSLTQDGQVTASGNMVLLADLDGDLLAEWLEIGLDQPPTEFFFSASELSLDAFFIVENGRLEVKGEVKLDLNEQFLSLQGEMKSPVLEFLGSMRMEFTENELAVFDEFLPLYPSQANLHGEIKLVGIAKFAGDLNFTFEPNGVLFEDIVTILPATAHFTGSYTELGSGLVSTGQFHFNWNDVSQFRDFSDLNLEANFRGSVQSPNGYPIILQVTAWVNGLGAETAIEYQFGNRKLTGGGWIEIFLDEYDDLEAIEITANLEDSFGYQLELTLRPNHEQIAVIHDPEHELAATLLLRDGLFFVKYPDGTVDELL